MELAAIRLGDPSEGPRILITGGVHGDEYEPMVALRRLAIVLKQRPLRGSVTLIPVVNEEAFALGSRSASDGLDLARTFPGRSDGSITERIAAALTPRIASADFYLDLHTGGERLQVLPLCGYMLHPDPQVLERQRAAAVAFGLPLIWGTDPSLPGRSLSVARDAGVPALYAEYLGGACSPAGVAAYVDGCLRLLGFVGVIDHPIEPRPYLRVEDDRPGSGHMQVCHPAPCAGFFEPVVQLGERVRQGALLGTISDPLGVRSAKITADADGVVIVLRRLPAIAAGESTAVVLGCNEDPPAWRDHSATPREPSSDPLP